MRTYRTSTFVLSLLKSAGNGNLRRGLLEDANNYQIADRDNKLVALGIRVDTSPRSKKLLRAFNLGTFPELTPLPSRATHSRPRLHKLSTVTWPPHVMVKLRQRI